MFINYTKSKTKEEYNCSFACLFRDKIPLSSSKPPSLFKLLMVVMVLFLNQHMGFANTTKHATDLTTLSTCTVPGLSLIDDNNNGLADFNNLVCPNNITINCTDSTDPSNTGYATLNGATISTYSDNISGTCPQIITRTWTANSGNGGGNTCTPVRLARWNMNNCGSPYSDYSEFTANYPNSEECLSVSASNVYLNQGQHSCNQNFNGSSSGAAMCIAYPNQISSFSDNHPNAVRLDITFNPDPGSTASFTSFNFREVSSSIVNVLLGDFVIPSDVNYPRQYGIRISKNGQEIFQQTNIATSGTWSLENFNFSNNPDFTVSTSTTFKIELLPYNFTTTGFLQNTWDVDQFEVYGCSMSCTPQVVTCTQTITVQEIAPPLDCPCPSDITIACGDSTAPSNTGDFPTDCSGTYTDNSTGTCPEVITRTWTFEEDGVTNVSCTNEAIVKYTMNQCGNDDGNFLSMNEFVPNYPNNGNCSNISASVISNMYGSHSCVDGVFGQAFCVDSDDDCSWDEDLSGIDPDDDKLRFTVSVNASPTAPFELSGLSFYEKAPLTVEWLANNQGNGAPPNDYPQKYGLRILANGSEVFFQDEINTTRDWTLETFNFSNIIVTTNTTFTFELLGYCAADNNSLGTYGSQVWDIDHLTVFGGCCTATTGPSIITTCSQTITIEDNTAPVFSSNPANMSVSCDDIPAAANLTVLDNCDVNVNIFFNEIETGDPCSYTIMRTWTATDDCGNQSLVSQEITVEDTEGPLLIGIPSDTVLECDQVPDPATPTASDNCSDDILIGLTESIIDGDCDYSYTINRIWTATDNCGNTTTANQSIEVTDNTAPVLEELADITVLDCEALVMEEPSVTDNCDDAIVLSFDARTDGNIIIKTWTATDNCGNSSQTDQQITIIGAVPVVVEPSIILCGEDTGSVKFSNLATTPLLEILINGTTVYPLSPSPTDGMFTANNLPAGDYTAIINGIDANNTELCAQEVTFTIDEEECGSIAGTVTEDTDNDDEGEDPIQGVTIKLLDADGNPVLDQNGDAITTTTDNNGNYLFSNVAPGDYIVMEVQPDDFINVSDNDATPDEGGDATNTDTSDDMIPVTVASGEADEDNDFVEEQTGSIAGTVTEDTDNDDEGEDPIQGVTIKLLDADGNPVLDQNGDAITTTTNSNGNYLFSDVAPGDYIVMEVQPDDFINVSDNDATPDEGGDATNTDTSDDMIPVTVASGEADEDNDFVEEQTGSIAGTVTEDTDNDDEGEDPIQGVTIKLLDADGNPVLDQNGDAITTTTNSNGNYLFSDVAPGDYIVMEVQPDDFINVSDNDATPDEGGDATNTDTSDDMIPVTVVSGEADEDNDFVEEQTGSIAGTVTEDTDNDDEGEDPIQGVTIKLLDADGNPVLDQNGDAITTTTNSNGNYLFSDVAPGDYIVMEVQPDDFINVSDNDATPDEGGDATNTDTSDDMIPVTVASGEADEDNDFVEEQTGSIAGTVTEDTDNDDEGEDPIQGVTIKLLDADGNPVLDQNGDAITTTTDNNGNYLFSNVAPGDYIVMEVQPDDFINVSDNDATPDEGGDATNTDTSDDMIPVTVASGEADEDNDFVEEQTGSIAGTVTEDTDNDDEGEDPIQGVTIKLLDADGNPVLDQNGDAITTTTDNNGNYLFSNVAPGDYIVMEVQPDDFINVSDNDATPDEGGDATNTDTSDDMIPVTVASGEADEDNDFVEEQTGSIAGTVTEDTDNDDEGEDPIQGVTIKLLDADGNPVLDQNGDAITTTTDSNGNYLFSDVAPGDYIVMEVQPDDFINVSDNDATPDEGGDATNTDTSDDMIPVTVASGEADEDNDFVEETSKIDETIYLEAECGEVGSEWTTVADATAANDIYVVYNGADGFGTPNNPSADALVCYDFTTVQADDYVVYGRIRVPTGADDSFWVQMDGGTWVKWNGNPSNSNWYWADVHDSDNGFQTVVYDLDAGDHTLCFHYRENGAELDKIAISNTDTVPTGEGEDAENCSDNNFAGSIKGSVTDNADDTPVAGVTIKLLDANANPVLDANGDAITATTDDNGEYTFTNVTPGDYIVMEVQPDGLDNVSDNDTTPDAGDDAPNTDTTDDMIPVSVAPGEADEDNNFVDETPAPGSIKGSVTDNLDDSPVAGVTIKLLDANANPVLDANGDAITATTDDNGEYTFTNVTPGDYIVMEVQPDGLDNVSDNDTTPDAGDDAPNTDTTDDMIPVSVAPGEADEDNNFLDETPAPGSIKGSVTDNLDDSPVAGVTIKLLDANANPVLDANGDAITATTDDNGEYTFTNVTPGDYIVMEVQPDGLDNVSDNDTTPDAGDDAPNTDTTDDMIPVSVAPGEADEDNNFVDASPAPGSIKGSVTDNLDDSPVAGVTIKLLDANANPVLDANGDAITATTDDNGEYTFTNVTPGDYIVMEVQPDGLDNVSDNDTTPDAGDDAPNTDTTDDMIPVSVAPGEADEDNNFVDASPAPGSIKGSVTDNLDDSPVAGVTIKLLDANANPVLDANGDAITATTDDNGEYTFTNVTPGDYIVMEVQPDGLDNVSDNDTTPDAGDDAPNTDTTDDMIPVSVAPGEADEDNNFVDETPAPGSIKGSVTDNLDDSPVAGVTIKLLDANANPVLDANGDAITATTDDNGEYTFTNVTPGDYIVMEVQPDGLDNVSDNDTTPDAGDDAPNTDTTDDMIPVSVAPGEADEDNNFVDETPKVDETICLEAECGKVGSDWTTVADATASNDLYVVYNGADGFGTPNNPTMDAVICYDFTTTQADDYTVYARIRVPTGSDDSFWVQMDNGSWIKWNGNPSNSNWYWADVHDSDNAFQTVIYGLDAGDHTLCLRYRENGAELDKLCISNTTVVPTNEGDTAENCADNNFNGSIAGTVTDKADDSPIAGVTIKLLDANGNPVLDANANPVTTTTNNAGEYTFSNVAPGDYIVMEVQPTGLDNVSDGDSTPDTGGDAANTDTTDDMIPVSVAPSEADTDNDFVDETPVDMTPGSIAGTVTDKADDSPIAGVTIKLLDANGNPVLDANANPVTTTTNNAGEYTFSNVLPGDYIVMEVQPTGLDNVSDGDSTPDTGGDAANTDTTDDMIPVSVAPGETDTDNDFVDETPVIIDSKTICLEAECGEVGADWTTVTDATASNGSYIVRSAGSLISAPINPSADALVCYDFETTQADAYMVYARIRVPSGADDSFWIQMDGGTWVKWNGNPTNNDWYWADVHDADNGYQTVMYTLAAGSHTLCVHYREDGAQLDKLCISNSDVVPTGDGDIADNCEDEEPIFDCSAVYAVTHATCETPGMVCVYGLTSTSGNQTVTLEEGDNISILDIVDGSGCLEVPIVDQIGHKCQLVIKDYTDEGVLVCEESYYVDIDYNCNQGESTGVCLEAECPDVLGNDWVAGRDLAASGSSFIESGAGNNFAPPSSPDQIALYNFNLDKSGTYKIWGRVIAPTSGDDSFWVRVDRGEWINWNGIPKNSTWLWAQVRDANNEYGRVSMNLAEGAHTIEFAYREDGALLDKICIQSIDAEDPSGTGELATNCTNGNINYSIDDNSAITQEEDRSETIKATTINAYPNPTGGLLQVDLSSLNSKEVILSIYTMNGQEVLRQTVNTDSSVAKLDLSSQQNGVYTLFIHVQDGDILSKKIVLLKE